MVYSKIDYCFKLRDVDSTACQVGLIYKDLSCKGFDKTKLLTTFGLSEKDFKDISYLRNIKSKIQHLNTNNIMNMQGKCDYLQGKWDSVKEEFFCIISKIFGVTFSNKVKHNTFCYLQLLPLDEIVCESNTIYLNYNYSNEQMFSKFIVMLVKNLIVKFWRQNENLAFQTNYEANNRLWLFAEIAVDAMFYNSELKKFCVEPTYKYFYSIRINNIKFMEDFRSLFNKVGVEDFLNEVYYFVYENFDYLIKFKHYLY